MLRPSQSPDLNPMKHLGEILNECVKQFQLSNTTMKTLADEKSAFLGLFRRLVQYSTVYARSLILISPFPLTSYIPTLLYIG